MGCAPTNRKRTIFPTGQANPFGLAVHQYSDHQGKLYEVKHVGELVSVENVPEVESEK
jgi:hypothetical protein